ncbi:hypothetical protein [Niveibacterium terrae]|uniref:hypothetical protein n=1 Tax=Niveibacterium terrae TaxID=3373598 RepID=UPI003A8D173C
MRNYKCKTCGATKESAEFYESISAFCKEHWKLHVKEHRAANSDYYKEFDRNRANNPDRVEARKKYRRTDAFSVSHNKAVKKYTEKHAQRRSAHYAVSNAIRSGKMIKQPCCICGDKKSEAHHHDYSRPLDVLWLCDKHHKEEHVRLRAKERKAA